MPAAGADAGPVHSGSDATPYARPESARHAVARAPSLGTAVTRLGHAREIARALREAPEVDVAWALAAFVSLLGDPGLGWSSGHLGPAAVVLAGATSLPLVVRRRYPLGALVAVTAGVFACARCWSARRWRRS
jgi:hypothetical protein